MRARNGKCFQRSEKNAKAFLLNLNKEINILSRLNDSKFEKILIIVIFF